MFKQARNGEISWGKRVVAIGVMGAIGYLGVGKALDMVPRLHAHLPTPVETHTTTTEGLAKVIARELEKTNKFQGDKKTYVITEDLEKRKRVSVLGVHVGDDVNRATISTTGSARGVVEFGGINESSISVAPDNSSVTIRLQHAHTEDVSASHEAGVARIFYDPNEACKLDKNIGKCPEITDTEMLQLADRKIADTVKADTEIIPTAETQASAFLSSFVNGFGVALLHNQDPVHAPAHIDVRVIFEDTANANAVALPVTAQRNGA